MSLLSKGIQRVKQSFPATRSLAVSSAGAPQAKASEFSNGNPAGTSLEAIMGKVAVATVRKEDSWLEKSITDFAPVNQILIDRLGAAVPPFDPYVLLALCDNSGYLSNGNYWKSTATVGQGYDGDPELLAHLEMANEEDTFQDLLDQFSMDLDTFGNAYIEILRLSTTTCFYNMSALRTRVKPIPRTNLKQYIYYEYGLGMMVYKEHDQYFAGQQAGVRQLKLPSRRGHRYYGDPEWMTAKKPLILNVDILNLAEKFFQNAFMGDMAITFKGAEYTEEEINKLKQYIQTTMTGLDNAHKVVVFQIAPNEDVKIDRLNSELQDASFTGLRGDNREEIAAANRVPAQLVGIATPNKLGGGGEVREALRMLKIGFADHRQRKVESYFQGIFRDVGLPKWETFKLKPMDTMAGESDIPNLAAAVTSGIYTPEQAAMILDTEKAKREAKHVRARDVIRDLVDTRKAIRKELGYAE